MSQTRGADVWAKPLSGARGDEKCLRLCLFALEMMTPSESRGPRPKNVFIDIRGGQNVFTTLSETLDE